jgi:hypothetical protein
MLRLSLKCWRVRLFENAFAIQSGQAETWKSSLGSSDSESRGSWRLLSACSVVLLLAATAQAQSTYTVTTIADSGAGSLRDAITQANATSGNTINFTGLRGMIVLQSALPTITQNMTITGPGSSLLTISGNKLYPVFSVNSGTVGISGLNDRRWKGEQPWRDFQ